MIDLLASSPSLTVAGHRGFKAAYPENTLLAFEKALDLGVAMLEFDLRLSKNDAPGNGLYQRLILSHGS